MKLAGGGAGEARCKILLPDGACDVCADFCGVHETMATSPAVCRAARRCMLFLLLAPAKKISRLLSLSLSPSAALLPRFGIAFKNGLIQVLGFMSA